MVQPAFYERDGVLVQPPSFEIPISQLIGHHDMEQRPSSGYSTSTISRSVTPTSSDSDQAESSDDGITKLTHQMRYAGVIRV